MDGHRCLQVLLGETDVFVMPPCNVMLRLTEVERLGDEGKLSATDIITRDSNGSATPSFVFWRPRWRNTLALCDPITATGFGGRSRSCGETSTSYSSSSVASMEKPSVQSTFSVLCCWETKAENQTEPSSMRDGLLCNSTLCPCPLDLNCCKFEAEIINLTFCVCVFSLLW